MPPPPPRVSATHSDITFYCRKYCSRRVTPSTQNFSPPPTATPTDFWNELLHHVGVPPGHLDCSHFKVAYNLVMPYGVAAGFITPLQDQPIENVLARVDDTTNDLGSKLLHVSMFSKDPDIFDKPIETMQWSPPVSYHQAKQETPPPSSPEKFSCVFVCADTQFRTPLTISANTTGRVLKDMTRTFCPEHFPLYAQEEDPSLPIIMHDEWLDLLTC